jgi:hypothetical protein
MYAVPKLEMLDRIAKQDELLLRAYQYELAKDPMSLATESSRSNLIAIRHTSSQMYGEVADLGLVPPSLSWNG